MIANFSRLDFLNVPFGVYPYRMIMGCPICNIWDSAIQNIYRNVQRPSVSVNVFRCVFFAITPPAKLAFVEYYFPTFSPLCLFYYFTNTVGISFINYSIQYYVSNRYLALYRFTPSFKINVKRKAS